MTQASIPDVVRVTVRREPTGVYVARSPDLPGPIAVALDAHGLARAVPERIQAWFEAEGISVQVMKSEGRAVALSSWRVMPLEAAQGSCDAASRPSAPPSLPLSGSSLATDPDPAR